MTHYYIEQQKPLVRGDLEGRAPVMQWVRIPYWGSHPTPLAAMRRFVEESDPGFRGASDGLIRHQWRALSRFVRVRTAPAQAGDDK